MFSKNKNMNWWCVLLVCGYYEIIEIMEPDNSNSVVVASKTRIIEENSELGDASINCIVEDSKLRNSDTDIVPIGSLFCKCAAIPGKHSLREQRLRVSPHYNRVYPITISSSSVSSVSIPLYQGETHRTSA